MELTFAIFTTGAVFMCFISSGMTAIVTNGVTVALVGAINEVEANFVFTS